jgi:hypothetical protein
MTHTVTIPASLTLNCPIIGRLRTKKQDSVLSQFDQPLTNHSPDNRLNIIIPATRPPQTALQRCCSTILYQLKPARKYFVTDFRPVCPQQIQNPDTFLQIETTAMPVTKLYTFPTGGSLWDDVLSCRSG